MRMRKSVFLGAENQVTVDLTLSEGILVEVLSEVSTEVWETDYGLGDRQLWRLSEACQHESLKAPTSPSGEPFKDGIREHLAQIGGSQG